MCEYKFSLSYIPRARIAALALCESCRGYYHRRIYTWRCEHVYKQIIHIQHYLLNNALRRSTQVE